MKKLFIITTMLFTISANSTTFIQSIKLPENGGITYRNCKNLYDCYKKISYAERMGITNDCLKVSIIKDQRVVWSIDYTKTPFNHRQEYSIWNGPFSNRFPSHR